MTDYLINLNYSHQFPPSRKMVRRIRNLIGTTEEGYSKPSQFGIRVRGDSWISYYRQIRGDVSMIYPCIVHDCNNIGNTGGHIGVYENTRFLFYGIAPMCQHHNSGREGMRSLQDDIRCLDRSNTFLVLCKDMIIVRLPENVNEYLRNLVIMRNGMDVRGAGVLNV